ncbi:MAG TPA: hypothetical protein VLR69_08900 [Thermoanaerobaculia bacterium]|nr:hypothetical protein [Thermoanaerobaculia bacterium]
MGEPELEDFVLRLEGADRSLEDELKSSFPDAIVTPADNFLGGLEIAVILKPVKEVLESVLQFVNRYRDRYKDASITIDKKKISLKGYAPGDAVKILKGTGFMAADDNGGR